MKKQILFICYAVTAYCLSVCNTAPQQVPLKEKDLPKHVTLIGLDGLDAHCLNNGADMSVFRKMMTEGAPTLENRSILPSSSACNWASMFMGVEPELHGYTEWGFRTPELPPRAANSDDRFPNIFGMYRDKAPEAEIGYTHEWEGTNYLVDTLAIGFCKYAPMPAENPNGCTPIVVQYIKEKEPNLCAIIYGQPDDTGYSKGWSSSEYFATVNHLDSRLTQVVDVARKAGTIDDVVVVLTVDRGDIETGHDDKMTNEIQTPIVLYGKNVKKGFKIPESTMAYDIAGTMAYLLDALQLQVWIARPILSAFGDN